MQLEFVKSNRRYYIVGVSSGRKRYVHPDTIHPCNLTTNICSGRLCGNKRCIVKAFIAPNDVGIDDFCVPEEGILEE
jgi:hypothetical protein